MYVTVMHTATLYEDPGSAHRVFNIITAAMMFINDL